MLRWLSALALLAASLFAQGEPEEEDLDEGVFDHLAFAREGRIARGERDAPAAFVRLADAGVLQVKVGDTWQDATLRSLSEFLAKARDEYDEAQGKIGKSGLDDLPGGGKAVGLFVSIEVGPVVPWQHLQWAVTMAAEQKYVHLEILEGKRSLLVVLPADRSIHRTEPPPPVLKASVRVLARDERPAKWGEGEIRRPMEARFRCGDSETGDLAEVAAYLRKVKKAAAEAKDPSLVFFGDLKAGKEVVFASVFDVMETFVDAEIPSLSTFATFISIPPKAVRDAKRLPYPAAKRLPSHDAAD